MNKNLERDLVLNPCIKLCKGLEKTGAILQWRRLDVFDKTFHVGSPDLELHVPKDEIVWIIMSECKKPSGGIFSPKQKEYRDKYSKFKNVIYIGITDVKELKDLVFKLSDYGPDVKEKFKEMESFNL
jgi:hypothetical protein